MAISCVSLPSSALLSPSGAPWFLTSGWGLWLYSGTFWKILFGPHWCLLWLHERNIHVVLNHASLCVCVYVVMPKCSPGDAQYQELPQRWLGQIFKCVSVCLWTGCDNMNNMVPVHLALTLGVEEWSRLPVDVKSEIQHRLNHVTTSLRYCSKFLPCVMFLSPKFLQRHAGAVQGIVNISTFYFDP